MLGEWKDIDVRTLCSGLPDGIKELYQEMLEYYNYGITMEHDTLTSTIY